ncbi:MAG: GntR family transcriptional regulator [Gemmataceae bacterium]|nr:GntR family transcriptional regulator [Gemmataceae bacterium]
MSSAGVRYREVREALAAQITRGELQPGDRLPSERDLQNRFDCARSVVRQALQALTRDGWVMSVYPRGYLVLGPRIPWISRLRPLLEESWRVVIDSATETTADREAAEGLEVPPGAAIIRRTSHIESAISSGDIWGLGQVSYAADALASEGRAALLQPNEITYDELEAAVRRRIVGYRERLRSRMSTPAERRSLSLPSAAPVLEMWRIARSTTTPVSAFRFIARSDRFEADYLIDT